MNSQKSMVNAFVERTGIMATWCEGCKCWTVHCPECGANGCGSGCDCGYNEFLTKQQAKLDKLLEARAKYVDIGSRPGLEVFLNSIPPGPGGRAEYGIEHADGLQPYLNCYGLYHR
jgi:hypothetical protein